MDTPRDDDATTTDQVIELDVHDPARASEGHHRAEEVRHHLEQEAKHCSGLPDLTTSLEAAEERRRRLLDEKKEKAHHEVMHAKQVAAKVRQQREREQERVTKFSI